MGDLWTLQHAGKGNCLTFGMPDMLADHARFAQIIRKPPVDGKPAELKVIECNLRASRSFP